MKALPPITADLRAWAQSLTRALQLGWPQLDYKNANSSAKNDGALLWDATTETVQVSDDGAFRSLAYADQVYLSATLGPFFINDMGGTTTTQATLGYFDSATTVARAVNDVRMDRAGRVVGLMMTSDATRTAGTATAAIRIAGVGTTFNGGAVQLNASQTTSDSSFVSYANGVAFTAGQTVGAQVTTSGWTPTTADLSLWVVVQFEAF